MMLSRVACPPILRCDAVTWSPGARRRRPGGRRAHTARRTRTRRNLYPLRFVIVPVAFGAARAVPGHRTPARGRGRHVSRESCHSRVSSHSRVSRPACCIRRPLISQP
jgi:hypothetical protein